MTEQLAPGAAERQIAVNLAVLVGVISIPAAALAYWAAEWQGTISALIGLGFVLVMTVGSAALWSWQVARNPESGGAGVLIGGVLARLPIYAIALVLLSNVSWIHGRSLAFAIVGGIVVTLTYEIRKISKSPHLFWVNPAAISSAAVSNATRSETL